VKLLVSGTIRILTSGFRGGFLLMLVLPLGLWSVCLCVLCRRIGGNYASIFRVDITMKGDFFFVFTLTLDHRDNFSVPLINLQTVGLLGRVISSSQGLYLNTGQHKHRKNAYTYQISMSCMGFETTIPASVRVKTVHALHCAVTVTGNGEYWCMYNYTHTIYMNTRSSY
jgi:hypothetical protein